MTEKMYDIVAVSSVCVDIQILADDALLAANGLKKGISNPLDAEKLAAILSLPAVSQSPGSPGVNVTSGISLRGGRAALIGKTGQDAMAQYLSQRIRDNGTAFTAVVDTDDPTTVLAAITTPDKERSFAFPEQGAGYKLTPDDIDENLIAQSKMLYLDAFLFLTENGRATARHAADIALRHDTKIVLALNNAELVRNNRAVFMDMAKTYADILVGDQHEFKALFDTPHLGMAIMGANDRHLTASITMGSAGAYILANGTMHMINAQKIAREDIVDTNGAGDQFAAGFLYGLACGKSPAESGAQGAQWASDVIRHMGAEPKVGKNAAPKKHPTDAPTP
jgi:fructokinase